MTRGTMSEKTEIDTNQALFFRDGDMSFVTRPPEPEEIERARGLVVEVDGYCYVIGRTARVVGFVESACQKIDY